MLAPLTRSSRLPATLCNRLLPALLSAILCSCARTPAGATGPSASATGSLPQLGESPVAAVVAAMTQAEKVHLVMGIGMSGINLPPALQPPALGQVNERVPGAAGATFAIPRLGIPSVVLADGPAGVRIDPLRASAPGKSFHCTAFPVASLLAASWDVELVQDVGRAIGYEARGYGVDILLAPALNLQRIPLAGRNFEYYSEDPLLSGKMAAALVRGVQSQGVGTSIKHFVANNHEWNRNTMNVVVGQRALRELYLRGFEIAVRGGQPWTVMSAYNKVNGTYCSESESLLTAILRGEWGYEGLVMTDWFAGENPVAQMRAGNDLLMPGTERQAQQLTRALASGELDEAILDRNAERVLRLIERTPRFRKLSAPAAFDLKKGAQVARRAAAEGMVLLKNDAQALPLAAGDRLALFGNGSYQSIATGTGSGDVHAASVVSLAQGLREAGAGLAGALERRYHAHLQRENAKLPKRLGLEAFLARRLAPELAPETAEIQNTAREVDAAIVTLRRSSGEFADRARSDFSLTAGEARLLEQVCAAFHAQKKKVIVVLNVGGAIETSSFRDHVDAILLAWLPGQEAGHALADVLLGSVSPSGKLPTTFAESLADHPSMRGYPGQVLVAAEPATAAPLATAQAAEVEYTEGLAVGYRHFLSAGVEVAYPFGHGLSYTSFEYGVPSVERRETGWRLRFSVQNTGQRSGREVAQVYVSAPRSSLAGPAAELRAFAKSRQLEPGQKQTLSLELSARDLAYFDAKTASWRVEAGEYTLRVGASAADIRQTATLLQQDMTGTLPPEPAPRAEPRGPTN